MAVTEQVFGIGQGVTHASYGNYIWGGHSFNPTGDKTDGYQTWNIFTETGSTYGNISIYNAFSSLSLSGYQQGHEAFAGVLVIRTTNKETGTGYIRIKDPDGNVVGTRSFAWGNASYEGNWENWQWIGIGVKASGAEIWKAGTYTLEYALSGGSSLSNSTTVNITNYPSATASSDKGAMWIEGENLCYICDFGWKITAAHDGTDYGDVGVGNEGYIWLETDGKIAWVDANYHKRMSKLGDRYGYYDFTDLPNSPGVGNAGYIWGSTYEQMYLMIVSSNGVEYRIGPGFVGSGDYQ